jgi:magnesium chelatase family protein
MLAKRFPLLLPPLSAKEQLEVVKIHSIAGRPINSVLKGIRPLCNPHQGVSAVGLIGGGNPHPIPGEISLAHHGVLFLDELPEFSRPVLESLRGPLENGVVELRRAKYGVKFPACFQLLAAMNPCPCGKLGMPNGSCNCSHNSIINYQSKISQPLRDRVDLHVSLQGIALNEIHQNATCSAESDQKLVELVQAARERQKNRSHHLNARLPNRELEQSLKLTKSGQTLLRQIVERLQISARSYVRLLRIARTVADLNQKAETDEEALREAVRYRPQSSFE